MEAGQEPRIVCIASANLQGQLARRRQYQQLRMITVWSMRESSGSAKAAVLPVPVWPWLTMSRPSSSTGMASAWIGDGFQPTSARTASSGRAGPEAKSVDCSDMTGPMGVAEAI